MTSWRRETSVRNLRLLPCTVSPRVRRPLEQRRGALMRELTDLDSEVIVVDVGADNRDDVFDFFATSASRLLVTSREPRALEATFVAEGRGAAGRTPPRP